MNFFRTQKRKPLAQLLQQHEDLVNEMKESPDSPSFEEGAERAVEANAPIASSITTFLKQELEDAQDTPRPRPELADRTGSVSRTLTEQDIFRPSVSTKSRPAGPAMSPETRAVPTGTVISSGVTFRGELFGTENISILGRFEGKIHLEGTLEIGEKGEVHANVKATSIRVMGRVEGNLIANERLELTSTAKVIGDVVCPRLCMNDGASFKGRVSMNMDEAQSTYEGKSSQTARADMKVGTVLSSKPAVSAASVVSPSTSSTATPEKEEARVDAAILLTAGKPVKKFDRRPSELGEMNGEDDGRINSSLILGN